MKELTAVFKALSDRNRLRIVSALFKREELCACHLTGLIQVTGATASRHMGVLIAAGLVESRKEGRWVHYRLRREREDLNVLMAWVEAQLGRDPQAERDAASVEAILSREPDLLCRRNRGQCCPQTQATNPQGDG